MPEKLKRNQAVGDDGELIDIDQNETTGKKSGLVPVLVATIGCLATVLAAVCGALAVIIAAIIGNAKDPSTSKPYICKVENNIIQGIFSCHDIIIIGQNPTPFQTQITATPLIYTPTNSITQLPPTDRPTSTSSPTSTETFIPPTKTPTRIPPTVIPPTSSPTRIPPTNTPVPTPTRVLPTIAPTSASLLDNRIVFSSTRNNIDNSKSIFAMNSDGSDIQPVSGLPSDSDMIDWSSKNQLIVFNSNKNIYTANADASNLKMLTDTGKDEAPQWSPDGTWILFHSWRAGDVDIFIMNKDGSEVRQVVENPTAALFPAWSPDGRSIVFQRQSKNLDNGNMDIWIVNVDGSGLKQLTNDSFWDWSPNWSPDGSKILFMSFRSLHWQIFTISTNGTGKQQITSGDTDSFDPQWSPDGTQIVFTKGKWNGGSASNVNAIYIMNSDGTNIKKLTSGNHEDGNPSWKD